MMLFGKLLRLNRNRLIIFVIGLICISLLIPTLAGAAIGTPCTSSAACAPVGEFCHNGTCRAITSTEESEKEILQQGLRGAGGLVNIFGDRAGFPAPREPEVIIGQIIQGVILVIGVVFGILVIYGGYLWMTARGNEDQAKKAMEILKTAVIGFILVVAAYSITNFVVDKVISAAFTP
ncbi:hypothetical protein HY477_04035 [Candidatus Uhrbacteria bacterium]|nr:hypothetical protein [Candidatus Uhrbacteria bacterium]